MSLNCSKLKFLHLLVLVFFVGVIDAQYCTTFFDPSSNDTYAIDRVSFKTINNVTDGISAGTYGDFTAQSTSVSCGEVITLRIFLGSTTTARYSRAWIDWNNNEIFEASERYDFTKVGTSNEWTTTVTVPASAAANVRLRINSCDIGFVGACYQDSGGNWGEIEDYTVNIIASVDMTIEANTVVQNNTNTVARSSSNQEIIGFSIETLGCSNPWFVKSVTLSDGDSDNLARDASLAKIFYTGTSAAYATGNNVGSEVPSGSYTISGIESNLPALAEGNNWFWLAYNIRNNAELDEFVDGAIDQIVLSNGIKDTTIIPSAGNPSGKRQIVNDYCSGVYTDTYADDNIASVVFGSINNVTSGRSANGYGDFTSTLDTVSSGTSKSITVTGEINSGNITNPGEPYWLYVFFDWNRDGDFNNTDEKYLVAEIPTDELLIAGVTFDVSKDIKIPGEIVAGYTRMRVALFNSYLEIHEGCPDSPTRGEIEDYGINMCGGVSVNADQWFCKDEAIALTASDFGSSSIEWFMSDSVSSNWMSIGTGPSLSQTVSSTRFVRAELTSVGCPTAYSEIISLSVPEVLSIDANPATICAGDTTTITITHNYGVVFQESADLAVIPEGNAATLAPGEAYISAIDLSTETIVPALNDYFSIDSVCLNVSHPNVEDLRAYLVHATSGKRVKLFDEDDLSGSNLVNTCFSPLAIDNIVGQTEPYEGSYLPVGNLNAFIGEPNQSVWELHIQDMDGGTIGGVGTLDSWSLKMGRIVPTWNSQNGIISANADSTSIDVNPTVDSTYVIDLLNAPCVTQDSITIAISVPVEPVVSISTISPGLTICDGDSITFTGTSDVDPALSPQYAWYLNGVKQGSDSTVFGFRGFNPGDTVVFETNVDYSCGAENAFDTVYVNVVSAFTPAVTISSDANPDSLICDGSMVVFSADTSFPGSSPTLEWYVNNVLVESNTSTYTNNGTLVTGDVVKVILAPAEACATISSVEDSLIMDVRPTYDPSLDLATSPLGTSFCKDQPIQFTASITDGTPTGVIEWYHNNVLTTETNLSWNTDTFAIGSHTIKAVYVTNNNCTPTATVEQEFSFEIANAFPVEVVIDADTTRACAGNPINLFVEELNNGGIAPKYQWKLNGSNIVGATSNTYSSSSFGNGNEITLEVLSNSSCASPSNGISNTIKLDILNRITPFVSIDADNTSICENQEVVFTVDQTIGEGSDPTFEWFLNGTSLASVTGTSYTTDTLNNGDVVNLIMHSTAVCTTVDFDESNNVSITVNDSVDPYFEISPSLDSICFNSSAEFSITAQEHLGTNPIFNWLVNGALVVNGTNTTEILADLKGDDVVRVECDIVGVNCATADFYVDEYTVNQYPALDATFDIDSVDLFVYDFTNNDLNAVTWAWDFGDGASSTDQNPQHDFGDKGEYTICLTITDKNACKFDYCEEDFAVLGGVSVKELAALIQLKAYPNPVQNQLTITAEKPIHKVVIRDAVGKLIRSVDNSSMMLQIDTSDLISGVYIVEVLSEGVLIPLRINVTK